MEGIALAEAAERLGVHPTRVGQLIEQGQLRAQRVGSSWLVSAADVAQRAGRPSLPGRPLAPARAWAVLDLLDGGQAPWLPSVARSQVRQVLDKLAAADEHRWRSALRARANVLRLHAHPAAISRLLAEPDIVLAGPRAAAEAGADLVVLSAAAEVYLPAERWPELARRYRLSSHPAEDRQDVNLIVHLPAGVWPLAYSPDGRVGPAALAADLLDSDEPRARRAGVEMLARLCAQRPVRRHSAHGDAQPASS